MVWVLFAGEKRSTRARLGSRLQVAVEIQGKRRMRFAYPAC